MPPKETPNNTSFVDKLPQNLFKRFDSFFRVYSTHLIKISRNDFLVGRHNISSDLLDFLDVVSREGFDVAVGDVAFELRGNGIALEFISHDGTVMYSGTSANFCGWGGPDSKDLSNSWDDILSEVKKIDGDSDGNKPFDDRIMGLI